MIQTSYLVCSPGCHWSRSVLLVLLTLTAPQPLSVSPNSQDGTTSHPAVSAPNPRVILKAPFFLTHWFNLLSSLVCSSFNIWHKSDHFLPSPLTYDHLLSPRLSPKLPTWFPYLYSCSAKVHAHTAAKIIFLYIKTLPLSGKECRGFPLHLD